MVFCRGADKDGMGGRSTPYFYILLRTHEIASSIVITGFAREDLLSNCRVQKVRRRFFATETP